MSTTATLSIEGIPDATAILHDDGSYEFSITGLAGMLERPRNPTPAERRAGIRSSDPPTVKTKQLRNVELLMLRAVEMATPPELLENEFQLPDKSQMLLAQIVRIWRRLLWQLEPPT